MGEMVWLLIGKICGLEYVSGTKPNCGPSSWEQERICKSICYISTINLLVKKNSVSNKTTNNISSQKHIIYDVLIQPKKRNRIKAIHEN